VSELPEILAPTHRWQVWQGDYKGRPLFTRLNASAGDWVEHPELPIKLGFAVPFNSPEPKTGLPESAEDEQLHEIEDIIRRQVAATTKGFHALVLTTGGMREFVFYIPEGVDIGSIHEAVMRAVKTHAVQCQTVRERDWYSYKRFSPG
jgi:hypothetical protein